VRASVLLVVRPSRGTVSDTALAVGRLAEDGLPLAGIVIGSWPAEPDRAMRLAVEDLADLAGGELSGVLPAGLGAATPAGFARNARAGLAPHLGGTFDWPAFRAAL
jgi:dethiobiotin synthetase